MSALHNDFSINQKTGLLNGFLTSTGIKGMLGGKDYCDGDTIFSFLMSILDRSLVCSYTPVLTLIHTLCSDTFNLLLFGTCESNAHEELVPSLQEMDDVLNRKSNEVFGDLEDIHFSTQKFHMLDRVVEGVVRYRDISLVDVLAFERFNFMVEKYMRMTSM